MKAARAAITAVPSGKDTLAGDWRKAAVFYARWGVLQRHSFVMACSALRAEPRGIWRR